MDALAAANEHESCLGLSCQRQELTRNVLRSVMGSAAVTVAAVVMAMGESWADRNDLLAVGLLEAPCLPVKLHQRRCTEEMEAEKLVN